MNRDFLLPDDAVDTYTRQMYSPGLACYADILRGCRLGERVRVLDVGCGCGQWLFAAEWLFPRAELIGFDINAGRVAFVNNVKALNGSRCVFDIASYLDLEKRFPSGHFDLLLCNSVIQYLEEENAFRVFGRLLAENGVLLMFSNHGPRYYFSRLVDDLKCLRLRNALYPLRVLLASPRRSPFRCEGFRDHYVTPTGLRKCAAACGLELEKLVSREANCLREKLALRGLFDCKGGARH